MLFTWLNALVSHARTRHAREHVGFLTALAIATLACACATRVRAEETSTPLADAARAAIALVEALPVANGARIEVEALPFDPRLAVAPCPLPLAAELVGRRLGGPRASVRVRCPTPRGWSLAVGLRVRLIEPVLVATRALVRGDTLDASNTTLEARDVLSLGYGAIDDAAHALGSRVRRPLRAGAAIAPGAIEAPLWVERGAMVSVVAEGPAIAVTAGATALDDGAEGEHVRVRNSASGRMLTGVVTGPGRVTVDR